jgi:hypothetical protein
VATGLVSPAGVVTVGNGPSPTVTRVSPGVYSFRITGLGTACVFPQLTSVASEVAMGFAGGSCFGGGVETTVSFADRQDHDWSYLLVGTGGGASLQSTSRSIAVAKG